MLFIAIFGKINTKQQSELLTLSGEHIANTLKATAGLESQFLKTAIQKIWPQYIFSFYSLISFKWVSRQSKIIFLSINSLVLIKNVFHCKRAFYSNHMPSILIFVCHYDHKILLWTQGDQNLIYKQNKKLKRNNEDSILYQPTLLVYSFKK